MPANTAARLFRFGVFEANAETGELRKHGVRIKLRAQPFAILLMLLERAPELVTRDEVRQKLWGDGTFVDFDHGLNTAINKIRDTLKDSAVEPRYVETISGKGYRFIAPVAPIGDSGEQTLTLARAQPAVADDATILAALEELPSAPRPVVKALLIATQAMYLGFYIAALSNLQEIHQIFEMSNIVPAAVGMAVLIGTAATLIPVRLFLLSAVAFDARQLRTKFSKMFPALFVMDLLWALSPFLLTNHMSAGLVLGICAALVYMPFAQRSLVFMYDRGR